MPTTECTEIKFCPCVNGVLSIGAEVKDNAGKKSKVTGMFYKRESKSVYVEMENLEDDVFIRMKAMNVILMQPDLDIGTSNPVFETDLSQAYAIFAAVKRAVELSFKTRHGLVTIICNLSDDAKKFLGFRGSAEQVIYNITTEKEKFGSNASWDTILGKNWDLRSLSNTDKIIKSMRFYVQKFFLVNCIKCSIVVVEGSYSSACYRQVARHNLLQTQSEYPE